MNIKYQERKFRLLIQYHELKGTERDQWVRSLSLADRNMIRQEITPAPNKLF